LTNTLRPASPPRGLSAEAKRRWRALVLEYGVDDAAGIQILHTGLQSFDLAERAAATIAKDGPTFVDRFGQPRAHPLLPVLRDARAAYLQAIKQLNFDVEPANHKIGRPEKHRALHFGREGS
jgi:hypothetical protein